MQIFRSEKELFAICFSFALAWGEHRHRGVIGKDGRANHHVAGQGTAQGGEAEALNPDPVDHG